MIWEDMAIAPVNKGNESNVAYEYEQNLNSVSVGKWIIIPDEIDNISVTVSFTDGAEGTVQITNSLVYKVKTGNSIAVNWPSGIVGITTTDSCRPVTAIRANQTKAGTMRLDIRAQ